MWHVIVYIISEHDRSVSKLNKRNFSVFLRHMNTLAITNKKRDIHSNLSRYVLGSKELKFVECNEFLCKFNLFFISPIPFYISEDTENTLMLIYTCINFIY